MNRGTVLALLRQGTPFDLEDLLARPVDLVTETRSQRPPQSPMRF